MHFLSQRLQIDVKTVPTSCDAKGERFYQYTAIYEYSNFRYIVAFKKTKLIFF